MKQDDVAFEDLVSLEADQAQTRKAIASRDKQLEDRRYRMEDRELFASNKTTERAHPFGAKVEGVDRRTIQQRRE